MDRFLLLLKLTSARKKATIYQTCMKIIWISWSITSNGIRIEAKTLFLVVHAHNRYVLIFRAKRKQLQLLSSITARHKTESQIWKVIWNLWNDCFKRWNSFAQYLFYKLQILKQNKSETEDREVRCNCYLLQFQPRGHTVFPLLWQRYLQLSSYINGKRSYWRNWNYSEAR